jgi:hypothetical protein
MSPTEFKERFLTGVRLAFVKAPPGLLEQQSEFVGYEYETMQRCGVGEQNARFLSDIGLPRSAPPFIDCRAHTDDEIAHLREGGGGVLRALFPLGGANGCGDPFGIETSTQSVVYYNHDNGMQKVFMNASIPQFAETLCLFQDLLRTKADDEFAMALEKVDKTALLSGSMWRQLSDHWRRKRK